MMQPIIDADYETLEKAVSPTKAPRRIVDELRLLNVLYYSFDSEIHQGQIITHHILAEDVLALFVHLLNSRFPIKSVIPITAFQNDDELSMTHNNSSCFNYRTITGSSTRVSSHAHGKAIDLNPLQNPYIKNQAILPKDASYDAKEKGTITAESSVVSFLENRGWTWGGRWEKLKDYQHFEKNINMTGNP